MIAYLLFVHNGDPVAYSVSQFDQLLYDARVLGGHVATIVHVELRNDMVIARQTDLESLEASRG